MFVASRRLGFGVLAALTAVCFTPLLAVLASSGMADLLGCTLDEGSIHVCRMAGADIGSLLYEGFVLGWLMIPAAPLLLFCCILWLCIGLRRLWARFGT